MTTVQTTTQRQTTSPSVSTVTTATTQRNSASAQTTTVLQNTASSATMASATNTQQTNVQATVTSQNPSALSQATATANTASQMSGMWTGLSTTRAASPQMTQGNSGSVTTAGNGTVTAVSDLKRDLIVTIIVIVIPIVFGILSAAVVLAYCIRTRRQSTLRQPIGERNPPRNPRSNLQNQSTIRGWSLYAPGYAFNSRSFAGGFGRF